MVIPCMSYALMIVMFTATCLKLVYAVNVRQVAVNIYNYRSITQTRNNHFPPKCSMFCLKDVQMVIQYFTAATALCAELERFFPILMSLCVTEFCCCSGGWKHPLCSQRMKSAFAQNLSMLGPKYVPNTCTFSSWFLCRRKELRASV